jgi:hypothetical protein
VQEGSPESRAAHEAAVASFKQSQDAGAGKVTA